MRETAACVPLCVFLFVPRCIRCSEMVKEWVEGYEVTVTVLILSTMLCLSVGLAQNWLLLSIWKGEWGCMFTLLPALPSGNYHRLQKFGDHHVSVNKSVNKTKCVFLIFLANLVSSFWIISPFFWKLFRQ